jgi:hypothetical protein
MCGTPEKVDALGYSNMTQSFGPYCLECINRAHQQVMALLGQGK